LPRSSRAARQASAARSCHARAACSCACAASTAALAAAEFSSRASAAAPCAAADAATAAPAAKVAAAAAALAFACASAARAAAATSEALTLLAPGDADGECPDGPDRHRVIAGVRVQVAGDRRAALGAGAGVLVEEPARGRLAEPGAHADPSRARIGPLALIADLDGRPGAGQDLAPRVLGDRARHRRAGRGEGAGQVAVLVAQRDRLPAARRGGPGDLPGRIPGVRSRGVRGHLAAQPVISQRDAAYSTPGDPFGQLTADQAKGGQSAHFEPLADQLPVIEKAGYARA